MIRLLLLLHHGTNRMFSSGLGLSIADDDPKVWFIGVV
jgi:hypothetical protein